MLDNGWDSWFNYAIIFGEMLIGIGLIVGGFTAIAAFCALLAALFSFAAKSTRLVRGFAVAGFVGIGIALALSGHASNAAPAWGNRPAVFAHTVCVAFWIGSLLPLFAIVRSPRAAEGLARFSRAIRERSGGATDWIQCVNIHVR